MRRTEQHRPIVQGEGDASEAALADFKADHPELPWEANLGLASTRQLLDELETRFMVGVQVPRTVYEVAAHELVGRIKRQLPPEVLEYRTVDS